MARHLFDHLVFDLDRGQIVDFRLKPWAEQFLTARVGLLAAEHDGAHNENNPMTPAGYEHRGFLLSELALSVLKYAGVFADVVQPLSRRAQIRQRYEKGERLSDLARDYGVSPQRVWQIVKGH